MPQEVTDQLGMDERLIIDSEAERALEDRHAARIALAPLRVAFREADDAAKFALARVDLEDGEVVRIGRFRVSKTYLEPRSVAFETEGSSRLSIKADDGT